MITKSIKIAERIEVSIGAVLTNRNDETQYVILSSDIKTIRNISFYLFGWLFGYVPEVETTYWLISLDGIKQKTVSSYDLKMNYILQDYLLTQAEAMKIISIREIMNLIPPKKQFI